MADKCAKCGAKIEKIFLDKVLGTYVKNTAGKKVIVCNVCQKAHGEAALKAEF